jgi:hypothetical protein
MARVTDLDSLRRFLAEDLSRAIFVHKDLRQRLRAWAREPTATLM